MKKPEFSKLMAVIVVIVWIIVTIYCLVIMRIMCDLSPMPYVMSSIDAALAAVLGFYYWKARAENQIKLKKIYKDQAPEPDFNENGGY